MTQQATPNSLIEQLVAALKEAILGLDERNHNHWKVSEAIEVGEKYLADRAQRPSSLAPTVAGSVDTPELRRLPELKICAIAENHLQGDPGIADAAGWYQFDRAGLDAFAIEIMDTYTRPAPSPPTAPGQQAQAVPEGGGPMQILSDKEVMRLRDIAAMWMDQDGRNALDDWLVGYPIAANTPEGK